MTGDDNMARLLLKEKPKKERNTYLVRIVAQENDGVYVVSTERYSPEKFEKYIVKGLEDLLENADDLTEFYPEDIHMPHSDGDLSSLESLEVEYTDMDGKVWDVEIQ